MFELPVTGVLQPIPDASSPHIRSIEDTYGVSVTFKQRARTYMTTVVVRGTVCKAKSVKEATRLLVEQMTGKLSVRLHFSLAIIATCTGIAAREKLVCKLICHP